jgi:large subunit ribosomal protein L13
MKYHTTKSTKNNSVKRTWHLVDVRDMILGRIATQIAQKLIGKSKSYFVRNLDCGDYVVVVNAKFIKVTGHKEKEKTYSTFSGYPGGLKKQPLWKLREKDATLLIKHAVLGMVAKNKLRDRLMSRLYIYPESDHPYKDKFHVS